MKLYLHPGQAGLAGAFLSILFFFIFVGLGFIQPGYSQLRNTVSSLVVGPIGWIQTVNFLVLALAFLFLGYGLGQSLTHKSWNIIFAIFLTFALCSVIISVIPTDKRNDLELVSFFTLSTQAKLHYLIVSIMIQFVPILLYQIVGLMKKYQAWQIMVGYTVSLVSFNYIVSLLWFYLVNLGYLTDSKGLIQKILITNVLVWMVLVGYKVWQVEAK